MFFLAWIKWACILGWREGTGRLYIFRDAPLRVVMWWASAFGDPSDDDGSASFDVGRQALDEYKLRVRHMEAATTALATEDYEAALVSLRKTDGR